jgi:hypothetical protein
MASQKENKILLNRRNFILMALISPFLANTLLTDQKIAVKRSPSIDTEAEFVILGGWVLLKSDLVGNQD